MIEAYSILDLSNIDHLVSIDEAVEDILEKKSVEEIINKESLDTDSRKEIPLYMQTAYKLAKSYTILARSPELHFTMVVELKEDYKTDKQIIIRKISQLENIRRQAPQISWDMLIVENQPETPDDNLKNSLIGKYTGNNVEIFCLEKALAEDSTIEKTIESNDKQTLALKLALWTAAQKTFKKKKHIIIHTEAENRTHFGQLGLIIEKIATAEVQIAIGSRISKNSITQSDFFPSTWENVYNYSTEKLFQDFEFAKDIDCPIKAFTSEFIKENIEKLKISDSELMLIAENNKANSVGISPIAFIENNKNFNKLSLIKLKLLPVIYRNYGKAQAKSEQYIKFIEKIEQTNWENSIQDIENEMKAIFV